MDVLKLKDTLVTFPKMDLGDKYYDGRVVSRVYLNYSFLPSQKIVLLDGSTKIGNLSLCQREFSCGDTIDFGYTFLDVTTSLKGFAVLNSSYGKGTTNIDELLNLQIGSVFSTLDECFSHLLPSSEIIRDPFSQTQKLVWNKNWTYHITGTTLNVSLEFQNNDGFICFAMQKDTKVQQGDAVSLLLDDGTIIDISIQNKVTQNEEWYEVLCNLYQEDIELLLNKSVSKIRITYNKGNKASQTWDFVDEEYSPYFRQLFSAYVSHFTNEVNKHMPNYTFPRRTSVSMLSKYGFNWCYVYLMKDTSNGYYKIGISNTPEYREKTLQSEKPSIEMLSCKKFPTRKIAEAIESALHIAYSRQRIRGEWFNLDDVDVAAIIETLK